MAYPHLPRVQEPLYYIMKFKNCELSKRNYVFVVYHEVLANFKTFFTRNSIFRDEMDLTSHEPE